MSESEAARLAQRERRISQLMSRKGHDRMFIGDEAARRCDLNGSPYLQLAIRLPSYRALPLSCVVDIQLQIDGAAVDMQGAVLERQGHRYRLRDLSSLNSVWWFVLDTARLFIPYANEDVSRVKITGTMVTVEPYMTAGRFSFYSHGSRELLIEP